MPRQAREISGTGIYHIMLRGINQQVIFEDKEDNGKLLETLKTYKAKSGYKIFAYCLMGNHFHLLIKVENEDIGLILKRVAGSYVHWYNWKYKRSGHLFQDRFKSEAIDDDRYFLTVLRYIHQNPINAGLCNNIDEYTFCSYNDYIKEDPSFTDIDFVFSLMGKEEFLRFHNEKSNDKCLDINEGNFRLNDIDAREIIQKISKCKNSTEFQALDSNQRDRYIKELKANGLSIRQVSRLTGISFAIVRKA